MLYLCKTCLTRLLPAGTDLGSPNMVSKILMKSLLAFFFCFVLKTCELLKCSWEFLLVSISAFIIIIVLILGGRTKILQTLS